MHAFRCRPITNHFILNQCLENVGEGLLHASCMYLWLKENLNFYLIFVCFYF